MISATYFDGRTGCATPVQLDVQSGSLVLTGFGIDQAIPLAKAHIAEPFQQAPDVVALDDGGHLEVTDSTHQQILRDALHYRASPVVRLQAWWPAALVAIVVLVALAVSAYIWGIPAATAVLVDQLPPSAEQAIGREMLPQLDKALFQPSHLTAEQKRAARTILAGVEPANLRMPVHLVFRQSNAFGANAFAMPDGAIVVTDQMIKVVDPDQTNLQGEAGERLAGVLAHEIGHIQKRHVLKSMLSNAMVAALAASLFGDFSSIAAAAPTLALSSAFSRELEGEADGYAIELLKQHGISPAVLADTFEMLQADAEQRHVNQVPGWMHIVTDYTSSHPADDVRIRRFRDAARDMPSAQLPPTQVPSTAPAQTSSGAQ